MRVGFWVCTAISVAVVLRRTVALTHPPQSAPPQLAALDATFASHAALTFAHILPALTFVVLAPFLYMRRFAGVAWPKRLLFPLGAGLFVSSNPAGLRQSLLYVDLAGNARQVWQVNHIWPSWGGPSRNGKCVAIPVSTVDSNVWMAENF